MPVVTIQDVGKHDGNEVTLRGWLYNLREAGKLLFPIFRDGTGTIQRTDEDSVSFGDNIFVQNNTPLTGSITLGASLSATASLAPLAL